VRSFCFLALPCFRCVRFSGRFIELFGMLQGISRALVSLPVEFVIG
jgi:hypothetical protein